MNILERYRKPTPKFFRVLRNIGIAMATIGGTILSLPITIPQLLINLGTILTIAGSVASAVSQAVVESVET
ncbi:membrane protein [Aequorivita aquimaris]|uniref:Membrane protein n=1 Tax=Aequorivita aquimaris TaxID=1548749 RepID=A0A137RMK6_9FLAO|nr:hypothetical protein [Aequorivita aquimaris]KXO01418.1 membrane protein [Aequorivita aquimaris]